MKKFDASPGLAMPGRQPVSIEIKPIMVGPAARPGFIVFSILQVGGRYPSPVGINPFRKTAAPIGIETRIDKNHQVLKKWVYRWAATCRQVVQKQQGRLCPTGFISVDAEAEVDDCRHRFDFLVRNIG